MSLINAQYALEILGLIVDSRGELPTVRVSSAQSSTPYPYWGAARGKLFRARDGHLTVKSTEQASSDRRSKRLAGQDAESLAEREGRLEWQRLGAIDEQAAAIILRSLGVR